MNTRRKRILVTGGSGYIGSKLIEKLTALKYDVINVDLKETRANVPTEIASVTDRHRLRQVFEKFLPQVVVHCAGGTAISYKQDPVREFNIQFVGTQNIVNTSNETGCEKIILLSSDHVYIGYNEEDEVDERVDLKFTMNPHDTNFRHLFGFSKSISEMVCLKSFKNSIIFRLASIYGTGECSNLIKGMIHEARRTEQITIWGDGSRRVQFTYLPDIINLMVHAMDMKSGIYNIANGQRIKLVDVAREISKRLNVDYVINEDKPEGPRFPYVSNQKILSAVHEFSFTPFSIGLEKILEDLQ